MATSQASKMGSWSNPPLAFVLAQVRFMPLTNMRLVDSLRDAIIDDLGDDFPEVLPLTHHGVTIHLDEQGGSPRFEPAEQLGFDIRSTDAMSMIRIDRGSLSMATTSYENSEAFLDRWGSVLGILSKAEITEVHRLGLRYVDFIVPQGNTKPEEYVRAPWNLEGMPALGGNITAPSLWTQMMDMACTHGRMRIQFARGHGIPSLPMDVQGMLEPAITTFMEDRTGLSGLIDTDRWMDGVHAASVPHLMNSFREMHHDLSSAFKSMITPFALEQWNPPAQQEA